MHLGERCVKLCYLQIPRQQQTRMEYSTVNPEWKDRSRLGKEKTVTDAAESCNAESDFPVPCKLHGMKDLLYNLCYTALNAYTNGLITCDLEN